MRAVRARKLRSDTNPRPGRKFGGRNRWPKSEVAPIQPFSQRELEWKRKSKESA